MPESPHAVVLGVAQDGGHPHPGCRRPCCVGNRVTPHLTTCVAVVDGSEAWLLDAGPDLPRHLGRLADREARLAGVVLTHAHIGHYTGLMFLGREAMNTSALPVWAAPRMTAFLEENRPWNQLIADGNIDLRRIQGKIELSLDVSAETFPVPHRNEYSENLGICITGPAATLLYVPDTDGWDDWPTGIEEYVATVDIALLDGTFFDDAELPGRDMRSIAHPTVTDSLHRFSQIDAGDRRKIHFTHLNHSNPLLRSDSDEYTQVVRAGFAIASENQVFEL